MSQTETESNVTDRDRVKCHRPSQNGDICVVTDASNIVFYSLRNWEPVELGDVFRSLKRKTTMTTSNSDHNKLNSNTYITPTYTSARVHTRTHERAHVHTQNKAYKSTEIM